MYSFTNFRMHKKDQQANVHKKGKRKYDQTTL